MHKLPRILSTCAATYGVLGLFLSGCGGSSPEPTTPTAAASASAGAESKAPEKEAAKAEEPAEKPAAEASADKAADKTKDKKKPTAAPGDKPSRPAHEVLQLKDTLFKLNFEESDPGKAAVAACAKESGGNPKKRLACMGSARARLGVPDGYRFIEEKGDWNFLSVVEKKNHMEVIHRIKFEWGDESENTVVLKLQGSDLGTRKMRNVPAETKFIVPSDASIVVMDSSHGKLIYDAKVGIPASQ